MLYLDRNDVAPVGIQPRLHFGQENSKPVADCLDIIWSGKRQINSLLLLKKKKKDRHIQLVHVIPASAERSMMFGFSRSHAGNPP